MSVARVRSWASSRMMTPYLSNRGSFIASLSNIPSVMYLHRTHEEHISLELSSFFLLMTTVFSHLLENCLSRATVLKPNGVADFLSKHDVHFVRHPLRHTHSCDPPGLGTSYSALWTRQTPHHVHTPLWDLEISSKQDCNVSRMQENTGEI